MSEGDQPDDAQKTEDPTPKRLEESRKKGQVAMSREVNNWIMLLAGTFLITVMSGGIFEHMKELMTSYIAGAHNMPGMPGGIYMVLGTTLTEVFKILALPALMMMVAAFVGPFLQVGPLFAPESIKPSLSKISIIKGFGRLFSMRSLMEFGKGIVKLAIVAVVGFIIMYPYFGQLEHFIDMPTNLVLEEMNTIILRLMIGVLIVMFVVAGIDIIYQRAEHMKKMRMTKQEIKDEYKQTEGDPHVKGRLRQLRSEKARQRMMQNVPQADVIITNPTHYSIALKYKPEEMEAPVCIAKGVDEVALRIREVAKEHDIIMYENVPLARALYATVELDEMIPPEHFKAVAEVISFVFKARKNMRKKT